MNEERRDLEELALIAGKLSKQSRNLIIATARGALFGEQAIRKQDGLLPGNGPMPVPAAGPPCGGNKGR